MFQSGLTTKIALGLFEAAFSMFCLLFLMFPVPRLLCKTLLRKSCFCLSHYSHLPPSTSNFWMFASPLGSDLGSVLEWRLLFLCNGARPYLIANLRPAVTSTRFDYVSSNTWPHLLYLEPEFWMYLYTITVELSGDVSFQVTYWHCGTNKGCSSRNLCICHCEKLIWVKTFLAKMMSLVLLCNSPCIRVRYVV